MVTLSRVFFAVCLVAALTACKPAEPPEPPVDFAVNTDDGQLSLSQFRGEVVYVDFWATWCGPCMRAIPHEKKLVEYFDADEFVIVGVNGDSKKPERALAAVEEYGITWRSFQRKCPDGSRIDHDWLVEGWPAFYLLDQNGKIAESWTGMPPQSTIRNAIAELIDQGKVTRDLSSVLGK